jgi:hypothetical protein
MLARYFPANCGKTTETLSPAGEIVYPEWRISGLRVWDNMMNRPFVTVTLGVVLLAAGFVVMASPRVEAANPGYLTAFACGKLPSPLKVAIDAEDDTKQSRQLKDVLIKALSARATEIATDAPLTISLYVNTVREVARYKGRDLGELSVGNRNDERTKFRMNLWSNRKDSVIGGRKDTLLSQGLNELYVAITVHEKSNGKCVWQGEVKLDLDDQDEFSTARRVIPLLTRALGRTIRAEPLEHFTTK